MAALDAAAVELAKSFAQDDIPIKLRCATCNRFAFDSVKLPCCDQSICGPCAAGLPEQCPICDHSPLEAEECRPNKALRMTIKAYLKNEEKKRQKSITSTPLPPPSESPAPEVPTHSDIAEPASKEPSSNQAQFTEPIAASNNDISLEPQASVEEMTAQTDEMIAATSGAEVTEATAEDADQDEDEDDDDDDIVVTTERPPGEEEQRQENGANEVDGAAGDDSNDQEQTGDQSQQQNQGFDQNQQNFGSMNFGMNGFNPMMGMGMPNFMGMPNMMGVPGMNMDPSMMFNGGFGGMDMSMMGGMGMGMNGFNGMPGMGMNGPNFFPGQGGYNNSNFGNHMHQNFRNDRGFGGRPYGRGGYGRGRGYNNFNRGRGGQGYHNQNYGQNHQGYVNQRGNYNDQYEGSQAHEQQPGRRGSPDYGPNVVRDPAVSQQDKTESGDGAADDSANKDGVDSTPVNGNIGEQPAALEETNGSAEPAAEAARDDATRTHQDGASLQSRIEPGDTAADIDQNMAYDESFRGPQNGFGGRRESQIAQGTSSEAVKAAPAPAPPMNAPTGPKAMREGKPNSGWYSKPPPAGPANHAEDERSRYDERQEHERSPSRSRSRSRHESRKHKTKYDEEEYESDETYQRRKDRERRKRRERERDRDRDEDEVSSRKDRSREESREDDSSRRRHRDKHDEYKSRSRRERSRERRKHRHRSRSPDRDVDMNGNDEDKHRKHRDGKHDDYESSSRKGRSSRDQSRRHSRKDEDVYEDKERSSRHSRSARKHEEISSVVETQPPDDFKIKGSKSGSINPAGMPPPKSRHRSDRRSSFASTPTTPATPTGPSDPYAEERARRIADREAREQQRVAKEQQRRQSSSTSLGKRTNRDDDHAVDGLESAPKGPRLDSSKSGRNGRKDRRVMNVKYEGEVGEDYDDRDRRY